jgi:hypothetical protein
MTGGGELAAALPACDALGGPHQRLGPLAGWQFDEAGDVGGEQLAADRLVERGAQRRADPLLGRCPDQALAADTGADLGVVGGAGPKDVLVALVDGVEHGVQVVDPQPVEAVAAKVGLQVPADVGLVVAAGVRADLAPPGKPPLQPLPHGGELVQRHADPQPPADLVRVGERPVALEELDELGELLGVAAVGNGQQYLDLGGFLLGVLLGGEPAALQPLPAPLGSGGQLDPVVPAAMAGTPATGGAAQVRATGSERPAGGGVATAAALQRDRTHADQAFVVGCWCAAPSCSRSGSAAAQATARGAQSGA